MIGSTECQVSYQSNNGLKVKKENIAKYMSKIKLEVIFTKVYNTLHTNTFIRHTKTIKLPNRDIL